MDKPNNLAEQLDSGINRRNVLKRAGMMLGAGGALAALTPPAAATSEDQDADEIAGIWASVISAADNSFRPFNAIQTYGDRIWLGSGQTDLTPAGLSSTLWAVFKRIGKRKYHGVGRFWVYDPAANPTGFATVDQITTLSEDGKTYSGVGALQYFDNDGNPQGPPTTIHDHATRVS